MSQIPETRASLILRLPSPEDRLAWQEFVAIYEPFLYRYARRRGLQDADARELVQNVLLSVARAVERWTPDPSRGKFRSWLFKIARNQLLDLHSRHDRQPRSSGFSTFLNLLDRPALPSPFDERQLLLEHRRELFRLISSRVKRSVKETTWQAFWLTSIEQQAPEDVAQKVGLTVGGVYIARSRVTARLKAEWKELESDHELR
ncbi:MAG: sigma-70 family RNA polymerase sigma factor [Planctomycetales bacterium]